MILLITVLILICLWLFILCSHKGSNFFKRLEIKEHNNFTVIFMILFIYANVITMIGVPGLTYSLGFSGMWIALIAASSGYIPFLFLGKKFASMAKTYKTKNFLGLIEARYHSSFLSLLSGMLSLMLLMLLMVAHLVGTKYVIKVVTGESSNNFFYCYAVLLTLYFIIVGVRPVSYINLLSSLVLFLISCFLVYSLIKTGGGLINIKNNIFHIDKLFFSPLGPDSYKMSYLYIFSYWIYLGFGVLGMPTVSYRRVTYNKVLKVTLLAGTIVIFVITFNMAFVGLLSIPLLSDIRHNDIALPLIIKYFTPPSISFVFFVLLLTAFVGSAKLQLITVKNILSTIYDNVYMSRKKEPLIFQRVSILLFLSIAIYFAAHYNLNLYNITLLTLGGFASTFAWPIIFIPFQYKFINKGAAFVSIIFGLVLYLLIFNLESNWRSFFYPAALPVVLSLVVYIVAGYLYYFFTKILFRILS